MRLSKLKISNFQSLAEIDFNFPNGLVLIDGWDEDSGSHNGVGKSALLNAITFAIYGKTPKDIKLEELVRDGADNMSVSIELESKGNTIGITRARTKKSGRVKLTMNGEEVDGLAKDIEDRIPSLVGLSFEQFVQVVYIFQGAKQRFVNLNDTEKKKFLSTLLDLDVYDNAYKLAHTRLTGVELEISRLSGKLESTERNIGMFGSQLSSAKEDLTKFEETKAGKVAEYLNQTRTIKTALKELELQRTQASQSAELDRLTMERGDLERKLAIYDKVRTDIAAADKKIYTLTRDIIREESTLSGPAGKCYACGQDMPGWDEKAHLAQIESTINDLKGDLASHTKKKTELEGIYLERKVVEDRKGVVIELMAAERAKGPERFDAPINLKKSELKNIASQVENLDGQSASLKKTINDRLSSLEDARKELENIKAGVGMSEDQKKYLLELKRIFSPTGIRAYVFDGIIKELNDRIEGYLDTLAGGVIKFSFDSEDQKGKFSETCEYAGVPRSLDALSGGEFRRLSLAIDMALADVVCSRVSVYPNILFIDEGFEGLDVSGRETVMTLLSDLIQHKDAIYIVDHASEFKTAFSQVFKLVKKNGETRQE